jgi:hypothetical protein
MHQSSFFAVLPAPDVPLLRVGVNMLFRNLQLYHTACRRKLFSFLLSYTLFRANYLPKLKDSSTFRCQYTVSVRKLHVPLLFTEIMRFEVLTALDIMQTLLQNMMT